MIKSIKPYQTIGIVGISKNTGKTTTLNALIHHFHQERLGLTSIGLDGEVLDQVNFLPKPQIGVYTNMVIATTQACLDVSSATFHILEETPFLTALGRVFIVKIDKPGTVMIAGPTSNHEMNMLLAMMKKYVDRIFVDGALSRKTFSAMTELDGIVLATGAAFSPSMEETVAKTKQIIETFSYPKTALDIKSSYSIVIKNKDHLIVLENKSTESIYEALKVMSEDLEFIYIRGALTERILNLLIQLRIKNFKLICEDPSKFMISHQQADVFKKLNIDVEVLKPCPLILITVNPFRPTGDSYDEMTFIKRIKELTDIQVINVKDRW